MMLSEETTIFHTKVSSLVLSLFCQLEGLKKSTHVFSQKVSPLKPQFHSTLCQTFSCQGFFLGAISLLSIGRFEETNLHFFPTGESTKTSVLFNIVPDDKCIVKDISTHSLFATSQSATICCAHPTNPLILTNNIFLTSASLLVMLERLSR